MVRSEICLLGKDNPDPNAFATARLDDATVIGISSVVTKESKSHNMINNEDAVGVVREDDVIIIMVADAHSGYVASHEAVRRFPELFLRRVRSSERTERLIKQAYLDSILELGDEMMNIGRKLGVSYENQGRKYDDISSTTFHSLVRIGNDYYWVGLGDTSTANLRNGTLTLVTPATPFFLGGTVLRNKIKEMHPEYKEAERELEELMRDDVSALDSEQGQYITQRMNVLWKRDLPIDFDLPYVQEVVHVRKLDVCEGDLLMMATDGLKLVGSHFWDRGVYPQEYIEKEFLHKTPIDAVDCLFRAIQSREVGIELDNVAFAAHRVY